MRKHGETGKSQALGAGKALARSKIAILPLRTCAGVEDCADDREIEGGARLLKSIGLALPDGIVAVLAAHHEVTPSRMEWDSERRIGLPRRRNNEIGRGVELRKLDAKMRKLSIKPKRKHPMRAYTNSLGIQ